MRPGNHPLVLELLEIEAHVNRAANAAVDPDIAYPLGSARESLHVLIRRLLEKPSRLPAPNFEHKAPL